MFLDLWLLLVRTFLENSGETDWTERQYLIKYVSILRNAIENESGYSPKIRELLEKRRSGTGDWRGRQTSK